MSFAHHEVGFQVAETDTLVDNLRTLFDTHTIGENPSGVIIIAPFAASPTMFELFVQISDVWVFTGFSLPDPLIDRLMANPIHSLYAPTTTDEFRTEILHSKPLSGLLL